MPAPKTTVTHKLIDAAGAPVVLAGWITPGAFDGTRWYPVWGVASDGQQVTARRVVSGTGGTWAVPLAPTSDIRPEGTVYRYLPDGGEPVYFTVPDSGPVALRTILARPIPTPSKVAS